MATLRSLIVVLVGLGLIGGLAPAAPAQGKYPSRPIEVVVPFAPGGGTDNLMRTIVAIIDENRWSPVPLNVQNRAGGGGAVGYTYTIQKKGNPHVIAGAAPTITSGKIEGRICCDHRDGFTVLMIVAIDELMLSVRSDSKYQTIEDFVKAARAFAVQQGVEQPNWKRWVEATVDATNEPVLGMQDGVSGSPGTPWPVSQDNVRNWADGLDLSVGGETIMFVDCEAAFYRTSLPRAVAQVLQQAGVEFGLMKEQWCCGGPAREMGYVEQSRFLAEHNVADWRAVGARRILTIEPHDYVHFTEDYPWHFGDDFDFEVVHILDLVAELIRDGRLELTVPINRVATYHDPCRLNKRKGIHEAPREILRAIPGLEFRDVDHVTQWPYCSGAGGGLAIEKPDLPAAISAQRLEKAAELDVDLLVSACVWSERPLATAGRDREPQIEVRDLMELVAASAGIEVRGVPEFAKGGQA